MAWKNKNGTSDRWCNCGSWKNHWLNFSHKSWPNYCSVNGCIEKPVLGAHIYSTYSQKESIVPMCEACNKRTDEFDLKFDAITVSANISETCG